MVHVDAESGALCVGDERRRISLDLDTGTASLDLGAGTVTVRALRWREKVTLARHAALGPRFVEAQFLRACTDTECDGERERELLLAVARWLNAPPNTGALPFDVDELARAIVGVCGGMGLRPADLDARPAFEIELLWHTIRGASLPSEGASVADTLPDAWTRIVVRPDPPDADAPEAVAPAVPDARAPQRAGVRVRARTTAVATGREAHAAEPAPEHAAPNAPPSAPPDATTSAPAVAATPERATPDLGIAQRAQAEPNGAPGGRARRRFSIQTSPSSPSSPAAARPPFVLARAASRTAPPANVPAAPRAPKPADASATTRPATPTGPAASSGANGDASEPAASVRRAAAVARFAPRADPAARPSPWFPLPSLGERERERDPGFERAAALATPPTANDEARAEPAHDVDALVAALSERFEEAAAEIGIAPWD